MFLRSEIQCGELLLIIDSQSGIVMLSGAFSPTMIPMKKFIALLLCLMMVLPVAVMAEEAVDTFTGQF